MIWSKFDKLILKKLDHPVGRMLFVDRTVSCDRTDHHHAGIVTCDYVSYRNFPRSRLSEDSRLRNFLFLIFHYDYFKNNRYQFLFVSYFSWRLIFFNH